MKQLIINGDDFGLTAGVSRGILHGMQVGLVSSTSALVCRPGAVALLARHAGTLAGRVGLHLQLTDGLPCKRQTRLSSLIEKRGCFPRFPAGLGKLDPDEIRIEWRAQLELFLKSGLTPSHIDTHHHVHNLPAVFKVYCEIVESCGARARTLSPVMTEMLRSRGIPCPDYCETRWLGTVAATRALLELAEASFQRCHGRGVVELVCHPGYVDRVLARRSVYVAGRERELRILCSAQVAKRLRQLGIEIAAVPAAR